MSYYEGTIAEMPENFKREAEEFICKHKNAVTLATMQEKNVHLTLMGFLSNVSLDMLYMQTNAQSQKVKNILNNDTVEISISNDTGGIILTCKAAVIVDEQLKKDKWEDWMSRYHELGCTSPNYVLINFIPKSIKLILIECV